MTRLARKPGHHDTTRVKGHSEESVKCVLGYIGLKKNELKKKKSGSVN